MSKSKFDLYVIMEEKEKKFKNELKVLVNEAQCLFLYFYRKVAMIVFLHGKGNLKFVTSASINGFISSLPELADLQFPNEQMTLLVIEVTANWPGSGAGEHGRTETERSLPDTLRPF